MPNVGVKLDLSALIGVHRAAQDAAMEAVGALRTEMVSGQVIPMDQWALQDSIGAVDQYTQGEETHTSLNIGDTPYARRLYFHPEYNFQRVNNPNAQGKWAEPWLPGGTLEGFVPYVYEQRMEERLR